MTTPVPPHAGQPVLHRGTPLAEARAAVILVHGRGASAASILSLVDVLEHAGFAYLAPDANGGAWYPYGFMAPTERNEPGITSALSMVHGLIDQVLAAGIPQERIVLLGFSQGACLASTAAQRRPGRYGGVIAYSGGLIGPEGTAWSAEGDFAGTPVFLGCSDVDPHIPESRVRETAAHFEGMGADVTMRIYPGIPHTVIHDEISFTNGLLSSLTAA